MTWPEVRKHVRGRHCWDVLGAFAPLLRLLPRGYRHGRRPKTQVLQGVDASQRGHAPADTIAEYIEGGAGAEEKIVPRLETVRLHTSGVARSWETPLGI